MFDKNRRARRLATRNLEQQPPANMHNPRSHKHRPYRHLATNSPKVTEGPDSSTCSDLSSQLVTSNDEDDHDGIIRIRILIFQPPGSRGRALKKPRSLLTASFLLQIASLFGLSMPTLARAASRPPSICLPSDPSPTVLYGQYLQMFSQDGAEKGVSKNTFLKVWKQFVPHVKVRGLRSGMCNDCDQYSSRIYHCRKKGIPGDDLLAKWTAQKQRADDERAKYVSHVESSIVSYKQNGFLESSKFPAGNNAKRVIAFNFAQSMGLPNHTDQAGPIYFKVQLKFHLFGLQDPARKHVIYYLADERNHRTGRKGISRT
ncbi:hypothetical protein RvY_17936 [Ramazzottius varieornatus]|uniref:Uncharacterized protein n=1 Tax=Ramazzottius varieornatus TaxID=947166 RepID=A0A1D1W403_RAMVA|nr:hypothetical protein RvY_17936 [Ramazzottius varieornatus]